MPRSTVESKAQAAPDESLGLLQRPIVQLCCVNAACVDRGQAGRGNLRVRKGKGGGRWRVLRCSTCQSEFSERKGTALWGTRMAPDKAVAIASHLKEGCGLRKTGRLVGASKDGVTSLALRLGLHARALHEERAVDLHVTEVQFDEKWAFVGKKQKHCDPSHPQDAGKGDQWDHTAIDVPSRFVVSLGIGKRDRETLTQTVKDFAQRTGGAPPP
jgi:transposase-like protein